MPETVNVSRDAIPEVASAANPLRILLVEDVPEDRKLFEIALRRGGVETEIHACRRAEEALDTLAGSADYDLVVTDHQLPGMDGLELCERLLAGGETPYAVVLLTGAGSESVAVKALKAGVHEYVAKGSVGYLDLLPVALPEAVSRHQAHFARRRAEEALRLSETRLRQVIDLVPHQIFAKDESGRFLLANRALSERLGRPVEEILGRRLDELHPHPKEIDPLLELEQGIFEETTEPQAIEHPWTDRDGEEGILRTEVLPFAVSGSSRPAVLGISIDVTEERKAEEKRRRVETRLLEAQRMESLSRLAGGVAHDFNNVLMGILGNASLALMELAPGAHLRRLVEPIEKSAQRAAELSGKLRTYAGGGMLRLEPLDFSALVDETARLLQTSMSARIDLDLDLTDGLPSVDADPSQLQQAISHLITNATEALEGEPGKVSIRTGTWSLEEGETRPVLLGKELDPGRYVVLEVADDGRGMDEAMRSRIFDPFYTTDFASRGLGLAAVLGIVRSHGGTIEVESELGEGSVFRVFLPASQRTPVVSSLPSHDTGWWQGEGTVLVVDDEDTVRKVARRILERAGFETLGACHGREAIEILNEDPERITAVLLDLRMPVMDGAETLPALRFLRPNIPVVVASGYSEHEIADRVSGEASTAVLAKPYRATQLLDAMRQVMTAT